MNPGSGLNWVRVYVFCAPCVPSELLVTVSWHFDPLSLSHLFVIGHKTRHYKPIYLLWVIDHWVIGNKYHSKYWEQRWSANWLFYNVVQWVWPIIGRRSATGTATAPEPVAQTTEMRRSCRWNRKRNNSHTNCKSAGSQPSRSTLALTCFVFACVKKGQGLSWRGWLKVGFWGGGKGASWWYRRPFVAVLAYHIFYTLTLCTLTSRISLSLSLFRTTWRMRNMRRASQVAKVWSTN